MAIIDGMENNNGPEVSHASLPKNASFIRYQ